MLGPGGAKPAFAATVGCGVQELHLRKVRGGGRHEDELGDPGSPLYQKGLLEIVVYEGHLYLAAVAGVDEPRRVDEGDPMSHREPAARKHQARIALRDGDRDPGPHQRPSTRRKLYLLHRAQIVAGITGMRPTGRLGLGYEAPKRYGRREILAHPQNGSIAGFRLQASGLR
jgi:hypothetical protein